MPASIASLPPLPASGTYIQSIRESCHALRTTSNIKIERESIERLLLSASFTDSFHRVSKSHGLAFPLQFPSAVSELNLIAILSLLNFASGYRVPLHEQTGRGAWDNIRALVLSLYISGTSGADTDYLSAKGMQAITSQTVAEQMRVSMHVERPHESIPGVTIGELGGPMYELVKLIAHTLNETGNVLVKAGYPDLGTFVLEALKNGEKAANGGPLDVEVTLEQIVKAIPAFQDMAVVHGQPIYCFKKALFLLGAIELRFGSSDPPSIPIPRTSSFPVYTDNVLPSMLVHLGVLDLSDASDSLSSVFPDHSTDLPKLLAKSEPESEVVAKLPKAPPVDGPALTTEQAYILRASAVDACEVIAEVAHSFDPATLEAKGLPASTQEWMEEMTLQDIDFWLWAVAKDRRDYRRLERFSLRNTVMF
ncbi:uncharacterized protein FOMMEDRAFT_108108 [Fomitiporia mediterranea MF3/22]|uniref:uncharacterized protein n=1 Tax=Fomitiporia mediterranea (strain MF3/22) TaxID=694068 RepID=UPI00044085F8|nr:uncharacterized protein FOMMEDRAFT_108108 [Fomitiporia mediterranea MF3/22]EJD03018.1 hypothetical protein FOMMEDRAFT_108108 [Fomitiporia mediterranea MF3/22]